jgi:hypothetical protein
MIDKENYMKKLIIFLSALMLALSLSLGAAAFVDIEDEATEKAVATLEGMGIVTGTSNTKYSPDLVLTRAQVCTIIVRAMGLESSVEGYANQNSLSEEL